MPFFSAYHAMLILFKSPYYAFSFPYYALWFYAHKKAPFSPFYVWLFSPCNFTLTNFHDITVFRGSHKAKKSHQYARSLLLARQIH